AVQVVFFVDTYLASGMRAGSLTALNYAFQLMLLPLGVFSIAISAAVFPALSHYASLGQAAKRRGALQQAIRWLLFLTLPAASLLGTVLALRARQGLSGLGYAMLNELRAALLMGVSLFLFIHVTHLPLNLAQDPQKLLLFVQTPLAATVGVGIYLLAAWAIR